MKLTTIVLLVAGAGVAYFAYKRFRPATPTSPVAGTPLVGTILDPSAWGS